jgi:hypothetical protein
LPPDFKQNSTIKPIDTAPSCASSPPNPSLAKADTAATGHYVESSLPCTNKCPANFSISVIVPDGGIMNSEQTAHLQLPTFSAEARTAHISPNIWILRLDKWQGRRQHSLYLHIVQTRVPFNSIVKEYEFKANLAISFNTTDQHNTKKTHAACPKSSTCPSLYATGKTFACGQ